MERDNPNQFLTSREDMEVTPATMTYYRNKLSRFFHEVHADRATRQDIEEFLQQFKILGNRHAYYLAIKTFYNWREGIYDGHSPVDKIKAPRLVKPMVELRYLVANDFTTYIVSGGRRNFMQAVTQTIFGIPPERVVGSAVKHIFQADEHKATIMRQVGIDSVDDGPTKAVHIRDRIGRRAIFTAGNANGDIPMLQYTDMNARSSLCLLVNHDDAGREFTYTAGAEDVLKMAKDRDWVVVSVKDDFNTVFASKNA